jgi:hypothetical protein
MATATAPPPADQTVDHLMQSLTDGQKETLLLRLLAEAVGYNGPDQVLRLTEPDGTYVGYYVPAAATERAMPKIPELTPEQEARHRLAAATPENSQDISDVLAEFSARDQG